MCVMALVEAMPLVRTCKKCIPIYNQSLHSLATYRVTRLPAVIGGVSDTH